MRIWCGIDWSERHHDVALVDEQGVLVARRRIAESAAGFRQLLQLLTEHAERSEQPILVAIETAKGLLPAALHAAGYQLFPINPLAVSRYRDRYVVSRAKSDPGDALVLANIGAADPARPDGMVTRGADLATPPRPTCSPSSTTTPARSSGTGSGLPKTPFGWPRRYAPRSGRAGSRTRSMPAMARRSSTPGCCAPAPSSGSG